MNWQPIETAPKDGTNILLCKAPFTALVGRFDDDLGWVDFDEDEDALREVWIEEGTEYEPTHWMPLPSPPDPCA